MKKLFLSFVMLVFAAMPSALAQKGYAKLTVAFYNLENLFDTEDGPNNDAEYLPDGANHWTLEKYQNKLHNMAKVISQIGGNGPAVIGVAEVENRKVLEDLVKEPALQKLGYSIVHYDSPDFRGIDCALLYRPGIFQLTASSAHPVIIPGEPRIKTRDVVVASGYIDNEPFSFLVGHWPSRAGGEAVSLNRRMAAAKTMRAQADSILKVQPNAKIIMMGDFNDDPTSPSVEKGLRLNDNPKNLKSDEFYTPMKKLYLDGIGTLAYRDVWNLFDIMVVNGNLMGKDLDSFKIYQDPKTGYYAYVFNKPFLRQQSGRYKGYPHRTMVGGEYQNGYSDHFPVYMYLVKEIK